MAKSKEPLGFAPGEAEAIVEALEPQIRRLAKDVWAKHPNNPANKAANK